MIASRHRLVEEIFKQAFALDPRARDILVHSRCGDDAALLAEVRALLKVAESTDGFLDRPPVLVSMGSIDFDEPTVPESGMIGPYRVQSILGTGGMGVVYLAEQSRPHRTVALKVIRPELAAPSMLRRFEFEAEVLGRLQHPGIAQIIEAGTHDTRRGTQPYFAMELVRGLPLIEYFRQRNMEMDDRIRLFIRVCEAVEHAHQRGVIHRDLKPGNILVTPDGQPKILDFGVARAVEAGDGAARLTLAQTGERQLIGTVAYMSPEQLESDVDAIDVRSDVYALGVTLFELLSGKLPHDLASASLPKAIRMIREDEPMRLGSVDKAWKGDLETIVAKALEKEKSRRYAGAGALAADLVRYLDHSPVSARPASVFYNARKFTRRHRVPVGLSSAVLLAIVIGGGMTWTQARRAANATSQREHDVREAASRGDQVASLLKSIIGSVDPTVARGREKAALRGVLDHAVASLASDLRGQPRVEADVRLQIAQVYANLSLFPEAETQARHSLDLYRQIASEPGVEARALGDVSQAMQDLASILSSRSELDEADRLAQEALAIRERVHGLASVEAADAHQTIGLLQLKRGDTDRAQEHFETCFKLRQRALGEQDVSLAKPLLALSETRSRQNMLPAAQQYAVDAMAILTRAYGDNHPDVAEAHLQLGTVLFNSHKLSLAEGEFRTAIDIRRAIYTDDHVDTAKAKATLAAVLTWRGNAKAGRALSDECLATLRKLCGTRDLAVAQALFESADLYDTIKDARLINSRLDEALSIFQELTGAESPPSLSTMSTIAYNRFQQGETEQSLRMLRDVLAIQRRIMSPGSERLVQTMTVLADNLSEVAWRHYLGKDTTIGAEHAADLAQEAIGLHRESLAETERAYGAQSPLLNRRRRHLGMALVQSAALMRPSGDAASDKTVRVARLEEGERTLRSVYDESMRMGERWSEMLGPNPGVHVTSWMAMLFHVWNEIDPSPERAASEQSWKERLSALQSPRAP